MISQGRHYHEEEQLADAPFLVIYNYRHNHTHPPRPRFPRPFIRHPTVQTHSIILTRKMAAEIQMKNHPQLKEDFEGELFDLTTRKQENENQKDFFTTGELERGIPMQDRNDGDILFNLNSLCLSQSHSKLQKILFGMSFNEEDEQFQQEQLIQ